MQGEHQHAEHAVGPVDESQALLLGQLDRLDPGCTQQVGHRQFLPGAIGGHTLTQRHQGAVRQRGQIAAAPERTVLVNHGGYPRVEQRGIRLRHDGTDARVP